MRQNRLITAGMALLLMLAGVSAVSAGNISFSGYVRNYTGILIDSDPLDYSQVQNTFDIKADYSGDMGDLHTEGFVYLDAENNLTAGIRELYADIYFNSLDLRIGKQQIIWGKGDGVFITDVVSPKDMSNFILPDFDEIRIGVTAAKADWYVGDFTLEGVWIPVFTPSVLPDSDSIWAVSMDFPAGMTPSIKSAKLPDPTFKNSEGFAKLSYMGSSFDVELIGGYMWDDTPVPHVTTFVPGMPPTVVVTPEYHRLSMAGGSFSTEILGVVFRGEGAYYDGNYFSIDPDKLQTNLLADGDGTLQKNYLHYMAGMDYSLFGINLSAQFVQQVILDYDSRLKNDEYESTATFLAAKTFLNETLKVQFFGYYGINNNDALLRPSVSYSIADGLDVTAGSDIFIGDSGTFGQYDNNDMVYIKIKYSF